MFMPKYFSSGSIPLPKCVHVYGVMIYGFVPTEFIGFYFKQKNDFINIHIYVCGLLGQFHAYIPLFFLVFTSTTITSL